MKINAGGCFLSFKRFNPTETDAEVSVCAIFLLLAFEFLNGAAALRTRYRSQLNPQAKKRKRKQPRRQ